MPAIILALIVVWLAKRTQLAKWSWNPLDWWNDATQAGASIISDVKNWVLGIVSGAVNLVENDVQFVWQWFSNAISDIQTAAYWFSQWAQSAISNLGNWANWAITGLRNLAYQWVSDLGHWAQSALDELRGLAYQWVKDLGNWAAWAINGAESLARQLVSDLGNWAAHALADLEGLARQLVSDLGKWTLGALAQLWKDLYNTIYRDFIKPIEDVIHWVVKAWDWVVWFAEHPFAVVDRAEEDVLGWLQNQATDTLLSSVEPDVRRIESTLGKWLGVG